MKDFIRSWIPVKIENSESRFPLCRWMNSEGVRFVHPFFDESITHFQANRPQLQFVPRSYTEMSFLHHAAQGAEAVEPVAFIFHVSRCGSTLFTQMLNEDEENIVLSEVPLFDQILRMKNQQPQELLDGYLLDAIRLVGRKRFGNEKRLIIKLDSWHLFFAERIRGLFPSVPFILLYRKPEPVLISHAKKRGMHMLPDQISPEFFGIPGLDPENPNLDKYAASVLETYFRKMETIASSDPHSILVSYDAGIAAEFFRAFRFAKLPIDETLEAKMRARSRFHSKEPSNVFAGDEKVKINIAEFASLTEAHERLEALRKRN